MSDSSAWRDARSPTTAVTARDIVELAISACEAAPEVPLIIFEDGTQITRASFRAAVDRFASWLHQSIDPGDRVAIIMHNRIEYMVAWIAVAAKGGILVAVNHDAGRHDARHVLADSGARVALVDAGTHDLVAELQVELPDLERIVLVDGEEPEGLNPFQDPEAPGIEELRVDPATATNVYYTSGTTGPPKGCIVGHDYWIRFTQLYLDCYGMGPDDRILCCLQFFYNDPSWEFLASLQAGTTLVAMRRFSVSRFWNVVRDNKVTQLFSLASIPSLLLKAPPNPELDRTMGVRFGLHVGIPKDLHAEMVERWGFPWVEAYGMTETGIVTGVPVSEADRMIGSGSIGVPIPGAEIRLRDDYGEEVGHGQPGEIWMKAPGFFKGYLNQPEALVDGWMQSGDVGRLDECGYLYFLGRKKDIIRRSGENVAAAEVEDVLRSHSRVLEAAVVPVPDDLRGEEVKAYVGLIDETKVDEVSPAELVVHCRERLAKHKVPRYIEFRLEPFPRTPSMRVKKSALVAEARDPLAGVWDRDREMPDWARRA